MKLMWLPEGPLIELARQPTDGFLVANVGRAKPATRQPAEVLIRTDEDHRFAHALGLDRRNDSGAGLAINDKVTRS